MGGFVIHKARLPSFLFRKTCKELYPDHRLHSQGIHNLSHGMENTLKLFAVLRPDGSLGALSEFHQTTDPGMQRYFRQDVKLIHLHYDLTDNTVSNTGHSLRSDDLVLA